jgi:hypothetical protein
MPYRAQTVCIIRRLTSCSAKGLADYFLCRHHQNALAKHLISDVIHIGAEVRYVDILYVDFRKDKEMFDVGCLCVPTIKFLNQKINFYNKIIINLLLYKN